MTLEHKTGARAHAHLLFSATLLTANVVICSIVTHIQKVQGLLKLFRAMARERELSKMTLVVFI
jgi:hypothetical protein